MQLGNEAYCYTAFKSTSKCVGEWEQHAHMRGQEYRDSQ